MREIFKGDVSILHMDWNGDYVSVNICQNIEQYPGGAHFMALGYMASESRHLLYDNC